LAPSPTGEVHIGTMWLAQFNWLYAKQQGGKFILRIEDTDQKRLVPGSVERLYEALAWYGFAPDEGPREGGAYGPYVQSERLTLYQDTAAKLVASGHAYHCFCTPQRLEEVRTNQAAQKLPPRYDRTCRAVDPAEAQARVMKGEPSTIRCKLPLTGTITHHDLVRGDVTFAWEQIDDSVILKSDGFPTYHLAVVVDDHLMEISHVFRAEEWLPSVPKHLFLYEALHWTPPHFAHFPLILGTDRSKLSKRHGATTALSYRDDGFLPEAMQNFLLLMGWHPKGDTEVISTEQAIREFKIEDLHPAGAVFDRQKLEWLNGWYIRQMPIDDLRARLQYFWELPEELRDDIEWQNRAISIVRDRLKTLRDIVAASDFLIPRIWEERVPSIAVDLFIPKKGTTESTIDALEWMDNHLGTLNDPRDAATLKEGTIAAIAEAGRKNGDVLWPVRTALSLLPNSPDVFDLIVTIGSIESRRRIRSVIEALQRASR